MAVCSFVSAVNRNLHCHVRSAHMVFLAKQHIAHAQHSHITKYRPARFLSEFIRSLNRKLSQNKRWGPVVRSRPPTSSTKSGLYYLDSRLWNGEPRFRSLGFAAPLQRRGHNRLRKNPYFAVAC